MNEFEDKALAYEDQPDSNQTPTEWVTSAEADDAPASSRESAFRRWIGPKRAAVIALFAALAGPEAYQGAEEVKQHKVYAAMQEEAGKPIPEALVNAQGKVAVENYWKSQNPREQAEKKAEIIANHFGLEKHTQDYRKDVRSLLSESDLEFSEDGKGFNYEGQQWSMGVVHFQNENKSYAVVGRDHVEDRLLRKDKHRIVSPILVGSDKVDEGETVEQSRQEALKDGAENIIKAIEFQRTQEGPFAKK
jgi:hypothetical protein